MSGKWPGGFIKKTAPTVVGPVDGEGGSASGIWTLDQAADYESRGLWPMPIIQKPMWAIGGYNGTKQLGLNTTTNMSSPVQIGSAVTWKNVFASWYSCIAVKTDGTQWIWGDSTGGQLGNSLAPGNVGVPTQLGALTTWLQFSGGYIFNIGTRTDGTLWATGKNTVGQLGLGDTTQRNVFTQVGGLTTWLKTACGYTASYAIKTDGTMWSWGANTKGELGDGTTTNRNSPVQIGALTTWSELPRHAGFTFSCAIKTDGTLWAWGEGGAGQLGQGNTTDYSSPVQVGALTTWSKVSCGRAFVIATKTDGTLWAWGSNSSGALGDGTTTVRSSPVQVGALTTWASVSTGSAMSLAITTDGKLYGWGTNSGGQLGQNNTTNYSSPVQVGTSTNWKTSTNGQTATLAIENI
jgi:alpha-tubulin suppressor-like RCC1 family protein